MNQVISILQLKAKNGAVTAITKLLQMIESVHVVRGIIE
jgi:hypothetical protein